jgi:membrane fusion protein (multidrug efflux system)
LVILDNRDQKMALEQAQAALTTAKSNIANAEATTTATSKNINTSEAAVTTAMHRLKQLK